jgi:hypothetical protein
MLLAEVMHSNYSCNSPRGWWPFYNTRKRRGIAWVYIPHVACCMARPPRAPRLLLSSMPMLLLLLLLLLHANTWPPPGCSALCALRSALCALRAAGCGLREAEAIRQEGTRRR